MTQVGEMVFVAPPVKPDKEEKEKEDKQEKVKIRFSLFFDGTLNNRTNIEQRKLNSAIYKKYKKKGNSYEAEDSNVAIMERYIEDARDYDKTLKTYVEGPGTMNKKKDRLAGYAFGTGKSGVRKKVKKGMDDVVNQVSKEVEKKTLIEKLTLDVFGFSRGAAGARNFIHEALWGGEYTNIKTRLEEKGYVIKKVEVCFAGLYDTVSSHGLFYFNDVTDLQLGAVRSARQAVQLAAAEEYRKNFSLTTIKSTTHKGGREIFLPGAHSDIGGGYNENDSEEQMIYYGDDVDEATRDREELIAAGWFKPHEIKLEEEDGYDDDSLVTLEVSRQGISNHYSRIPLQLMARFAREQDVGMNIRGQLERDKSVSGSLGSVKQKLDSYAASKAKTSSANDWLHNESWLRDLRHNYLHFSSRYNFGHEPRYRDGKRYRKRYEG